MNPIFKLLNTPGATLLDVRSPQEFAAENLPHSINIPVDQIELKLNEIKNLSRPLIVYCRSGSRSSVSCTILKNAGLQDVHNGGSIYDIQFEIQ